ncbi:MAG TPA: VWA domain-containing protein, partial [Polyangiaceae bacterium]|nr:VWA domain-containing protein [Polyangiaceae bacterium]
MTLTEQLSRLVPDRRYLLKWFRHREAIETWPDGDRDRWILRAARAVAGWAKDRSAVLPPLERQEASLRAGLDDTLPLAEAAAFVTVLYPQAHAWSRPLPDDADHRRALGSAWDAWRAQRQAQERDRTDAAALPEFQKALWTKIQRLAEAEAAVRGLLTERDVGWDLDEGLWDELDFAPLEAAAKLLEGEPALRRVAELLGRDYRARLPQVHPPFAAQETELEPGRTEIRGVRFGDEIGQLVSSEAALLAHHDTQTLFFQKAAESRLLIWDHFTPAQKAWTSDAKERQKHNERGPMVIVLDTSGSMRGKPEEVAKTAVLALLRVALEEDRACYLVNFSSQIRCADLSNLREQLPELLRFLKFSFHGGTDLNPALKECLRVLDEGRYRDADVLVVSDFSVPKIAAP